MTKLQVSLRHATGTSQTRLAADEMRYLCRTSLKQRTPRLRAGCMLIALGAGSLMRGVDMAS